MSDVPTLGDESEETRESPEKLVLGDVKANAEAVERIETTVFSVLEKEAMTLEQDFSSNDLRIFTENFLERGFDPSIQEKAQMNEMAALTGEGVEQEDDEPDLIEQALAPDPTETRRASGTVGDDEKYVEVERVTEDTAKNETLNMVRVYVGEIDTAATKESFDDAEESVDYFEQLIDKHDLEEDSA